MKQLRMVILGALLASLLWPGGRAIQAQEGEGMPPAEPSPSPQSPAVPRVHVVQEGQNLTNIAAQYEVSVQDLLLVNGLDEDDLIFPGDELIIPGAEGEAVATTYTVQVGDTLEGIAAMFNTSRAAVAETNHLVGPYSLIAGETLAIVSKTGSTRPQVVTGTMHYVQPGETLLQIAARYNVAPRAIVEMNGLQPPAPLFPGKRLRLPGPGGYQFLPDGWKTVRVQPLPITQGESASIYVDHALAGTPDGSFAGQNLYFAPYEEGYVALVGLDAFAEPGHYTLQMSGSGEQRWWPFRQNVQIVPGQYVSQTINVPEEMAPLLAPEIRAEEDAFLSTIYSQFTPERYWQDLFQEPVTNTVVTAGYGGARSYNGGPFEIFHTGVDFGGNVGTAVMAPAPGEVVYTGTLELRGNTIIVDHGLGVHSGYYHLSEILVDVGDKVQAEQIIARGGSTGLSTGPHLHWELRVLDVPVNGLQWTEIPFP